MRVLKLDFQAGLFATRLKIKTVRTLTVAATQIFILTGGTNFPHGLNSNENLSNYAAICVCQNLEYTSIKQWHHIATKDNSVANDTC